MRFSALIVTLLTIWLVAPSSAFALAPAQGLSKTLYKDQVNGFKFRPINKCTVVPSQEDMEEAGLLSRMDHDEEPVAVWVFRFDDSNRWPALQKKDKDREDEDEKERGDDESYVKTRRLQIEDVLGFVYDTSFKPDRAIENKKIKVNGEKGLYRAWNAGSVRVDVFSYPGPVADFHLVYVMTRQLDRSKKGKKWRSVFSKSGRSFDREKRMAAVDTSKLSYKELLKYHKDRDKQFKDWRVIGTPSEQFILKTSSKRGAFIKNVIAHLERSRSLFEDDFPPEKYGMKLDAVSIVRVCGTEEEFHQYGSTERGIVGWFNPSSEELVLFAGEKDKQGDQLTMGVMTHEAFHQYCHFLFQRSEAHRWFDEGLGDYYIDAKWFQGKIYVRPDLDDPLCQLPGAQQLVREGKMVPLEEHLNFSHRQWQSKGVASYMQSWSIVYMLRKGAEGKVPRKYWKDEYANILPNYVTTLHKGYQEEYAKILKRRKSKAEKEDRELTEKERELSRKDISITKKKKIWKAAMEASWGKVDLEQFEAHWLDYVENAID